MESCKESSPEEPDGNVETGDYRFNLQNSSLREENQVNVFEELERYCKGDRDKFKCGDRFVIGVRNPFRQVWNVVLIGLLLYTGTILPYRITFWDFAIPTRVNPKEGWQIFDHVIDVLFWIDLIVNFFFSVEQDNGFEVVSLYRIVVIYLRGYFCINLIACIPEQLIQEIVQMFYSENAGDYVPGSSAPQLSRIARLNRISRLSRLVRLVRLMKIASVISNNKAWKALQELRGIRIMNFTLGLIWVCHMMACCWYLVACLHGDYEDTWIARRSTGDGVPLLEVSKPFDHWLTCMYFVLTVFTTVGFGDMSASTVGEMISCCFMMLVGAVVNSIIVGEMINVVTSRDEADVEYCKRQGLMNAFTSHTHLDSGTKDLIDKWINTTRHDPAEHHDHRSAMTDMLTGAKVPRTILNVLPDKVFGGDLKRNKLIQICLTRALTLPARFVLQVSLAVDECFYKEGEIIYQIHDHPFNLFLVTSGTFAHIARPTSEGGVSETWAIEAASRSKELKVHSMASGSQEALLDPDNQTNAHKSFFPYQLFSARNYLGEVEILTSGARMGTARCETSQGRTLVLHKSSLSRLMQEFPHFADAWVHSACRREQARRALLHNFKFGRTYKQLAAVTVQRFWRMILPKFRESAGQPRSSSKSRSHWESNSQFVDKSLGEGQAKKHATPASQADVEALRNEMRKGMEEFRLLIKESVSSLREEVLRALPPRPNQALAEVTPQAEDQNDTSVEL